MDTRTLEIIELAQALMRFKSTSDNAFELNRVIDFVEQYFKDEHVIIERHAINKKPAIVILLEKTKNPELFLNCHLDVVPASEKMFNPIVKDGILHGRGAIDDKLPAAAIMHLTREFARQKKLPSLGLMLTTDEELGGENGVKKLLDTYSCNFAIVPDGGSMQAILKMKGIVQVRIIARGKAAHGSQPWLGENAIEKLMRAYFEIRKEFPASTAENRWMTTINPSVIKAGDAINRIPDYAELYIDIRHPETETKDKILARLKTIKGIEVELLTTANPMHAEANNEYMKKFLSAGKKVLGKDIEISVEYGASDARYFTEKNIPAMVYRPVGKNEHAENEQASIESVRLFYDVLYEFIDKHIRKF